MTTGYARRAGVGVADTGDQETDESEYYQQPGLVSPDMPTPTTSALPAQAQPAQPGPPGAKGLADAEHLLAQHLEAVRKRFGPAALGVIDLPALQPGRLVAEHIRVCAVLYWTSEVEQAGALPFVEALAEGVIRGTIVQPLGAVMPELTRFWRARQHRFTAPERRALFLRIFGMRTPEAPGAPAQQPTAPGAMMPPVSGFPSSFFNLIRALVAIGRAPLDQGIDHLSARAVVSAQQVGGELSNAGMGVAGFAARDIVAQVRTALQLLQHADLARALGGGSPWQIVARHAPEILGRNVRPDTHATRALSGMRIIAWIASQAAAIDGGALRIPRNASIIREAEAWSAASGVG